MPRSQPDHLVLSVEQHPGPVHSRVEIDEEADAGAAPRRHHRRVLHQHRDGGAGIVGGDALDQIHLRAGDRIGEQHVGESGGAGGLQLEGGGGLGLENAAVADAAHDQAELGALQVRPPAVGVSVEQADRGVEVGVHGVQVDDQRGRADSLDPADFGDGQQIAGLEGLDLHGAHAGIAQFHCSIAPTHAVRNALAWNPSRTR